MGANEITQATLAYFWGNILTFELWSYNIIFNIETFLKCKLQKCEKKVPNFIYFNILLNCFSIGPF
jgi:hypothetical protein